MAVENVFATCRFRRSMSGPCSRFALNTSARRTRLEPEMSDRPLVTRAVRKLA
jgi:hypothetical protein